MMKITILLNYGVNEIKRMFFMLYDPNKPLVVQSNGVIVAEVNHDQFQIIQPILHQIASLQKVTTNAYTYQLSSYSIWSAQKLGIQFDEFINFLKEYCKFEVSQTIVQYIQDQYDRSLAVTMKKEGTLHTVRFSSTEIASILLKDKAVKKLLKRTEDAKTYEFELRSRGKLKSLFLECGFFTNDEIGYYQGEPLECTLKNVKLRPYQKEAVEKFYKYGKSDGGNGLVIMPCGSGKTIVGLGIIEKIKEEVLIITSNETSISQWKREIIDKTCLTEEQVGSYTSNAKQVRPITITSYQMMIYRDHSKRFIHLPLFNERNWGLIIYDEVHLLPAPVFRMTAEIQGKRRLGLTATLIREDGKEEEAYSLVGPKQYEVSWKGLENNGWIAKTTCKEIRVDLSRELVNDFIQCNKQKQYKLASINPQKLNVVKKIIDDHKGKPILIIGQYLDQLTTISEQLNVPMITGRTTQKEREELYSHFRQGKIAILVVSKVANFAVDLPDAEVAIQISGTFGSRQEEAQRIGRVLRPKKNGNDAYFYSIVTKNTREELCSQHRQMFMLEQGYTYEVEEWTS